MHELLDDYSTGHELSDLTFVNTTMIKNENLDNLQVFPGNHNYN